MVAMLARLMPSASFMPASDFKKLKTVSRLYEQLGGWTSEHRHYSHISFPATHASPKCLS